MWARSHTSGLIRGLCCRVSSSSSTPVSSRLRTRAASRPRAAVSRMCFLLQDTEGTGGLGAGAQLRARGAPRGDELGERLQVGFQLGDTASRGQTDTAADRRTQGVVAY